MTPESPISRLARSDGHSLAYRHTPGRTPGILFLPGFRSDMTGTKATALETHCRGAGRAFARFDYFGHGASSGTFTDGTIGRWIEDATAVLDTVLRGPVVLVGSSMGGWLMLHVALQRPERVVGLVGVAPAPDFTEDLIWQAGPESMRTTLRETGVYFEPSAYDPEPTPITLRLIEEGRRHLLMRGRIAISCPMRLLHGMADRDVPYVLSLRLAAAVQANDVRVSLIKDGDHRLSRPEDLALLGRAVDDLAG
ncbi:MAG: alpha/beta hydrolase [Alphaproteobacteria bacterium]|nr:alpha/beta hydrolase [Alphaproteobacteria bacterium]